MQTRSYAQNLPLVMTDFLFEIAGDLANKLRDWMRFNTQYQQILTTHLMSHSFFDFSLNFFLNEIMHTGLQASADTLFDTVSYQCLQFSHARGLSLVLFF